MTMNGKCKTWSFNPVMTRLQGLSYYTFIWIVILTLIHIHGYTQIPKHAKDLWSRNYKFRHLSIEEGLSQSLITDLLQDKNGLIWISTLDGLNVYDGYTFNVYRQDSANYLLDNRVNALEQSESGKIWVAGYTGLMAIDNRQTQKFERYPFSIDSIHYEGVPVSDLKIGGEKEILLATPLGLLTFSIATSTYELPKQFESLFGVIISRLERASPNQYWVGTETDGLYLVDMQKGPIAHYTYGIEGDKQPFIINSLHQHAGELYIGTASGLFKLKPGEKKFEKIDLGTENNVGQVHETLMDKDGTLWVFTSANILLLDQHKTIITSLRLGSSITNLSNNFVNTAIQSRDGLIWFGTEGDGVNICNPQSTRFGFLTATAESPISLINKQVFGLYAENEDEIFIGTSSGLNIYYPSRKEIRSYLKSPDGRYSEPYMVTTIFKDSRGVKWLGTTAGLVRYRPTSKDIERHLDWLEGQYVQIRNIKELRPGVLILATRNNGLITFDYDHNKILSQLYTFGDTKVKVNEASYLLQEKGNTYWIGTSYGLYLYNFDTNESKGFYHDPKNRSSLSTNQIKSMYRDTKGRLWIATLGGGLDLFNDADSTFTNFSEKDGLPNTTIYGILEDAYGRLWLSTNRGLSVFHPEQKRFSNFDYRDGLQSNEFNTGSFARLPSGKLLFGGVNGVNLIDPSEFLEIPEPTLPFLTSVFVDHVQVPFTSSTFEIDWHNQVKFEVSSLLFFSSSEAKYQFKLKNFDKTWSAPGVGRYINYTNLPPGNYVFSVKSLSPYGIWSPEADLLQLHVTAPIWYYTWFQVAAGICFSVLIFFMIRYREKRLKESAAKLEEMVIMRTKEIQSQKEEIARQNTQLTMQTAALGLQNAALEKNERELRITKDSLEKMVEARTLQIQQSNRELIDQNAKLEQFTFITAHNLRAPIAQLKGLVSLLPKEENLEKNIWEVIGRIKDSAYNLDDVVHDLNEILNIKSTTEKSLEPVDLSEQIRVSLETLELEIKSKGAKIIIQEEQGIVVLGIKAYIQSILYNLIHNALKFSKRNVLPVIQVITSANENYATLIVSDTGVGMDLQKIGDKIFKLYQRFNLEAPGKGLGLFLIKTQIESMHGTIEVQSEPEMGTTFTINIPLVKDERM